jgi:aspartyl-tRNA synthetase
VREELRLRYRFIDLRRPKMYHNLLTRHKTMRAVQNFLDKDGFLFVETPILCKSTPEGARDYLVPSRVHPGSFYALPQSPQIFKQLLMVGGLDKYYQVARCFRDEDLRSDRQPEFTQVDLEMSFADQEDILELLEELFSQVTNEITGAEIARPFQRLTWLEAMDLYGSDKPDLRFGLPITDVTREASAGTFAVFNDAAAAGGVIRAITVPGGAAITRADIDALTDKAVSYGAKGMAWIIIRPDGSINSILPKYYSEEAYARLIEKLGAAPNDFILFSADKPAVVRRVLGLLRLDLAGLFKLRSREYKFVIVTDFPQFEYSEDEGRYVATHHPFTMPYPEDMEYLKTQPERVRAQAYDVVLNGVELGSGSVRIHDSRVQREMFEALGFSEAEVEERFGFMVNAFKYGAPPHAGFGFGFDRFVMLLLGADSLREVIAFPKARDASCPMTGAPSPVSAEQLAALNLTESAAVPKQSAAKMDVENISHLARLYLAKDEKQRYERDMADIIAFADRLSEIDTTGAPGDYLMPLKNVFRQDVPAQSFSRDALLANAPDTEGGWLAVPRVISDK